MSFEKEQQMNEWQNALHTILKHVDSDDSVLRARAIAIKKLIDTTIDDWIKIDEAHTLYTWPTWPNWKPTAKSDGQLDEEQWALFRSEIETARNEVEVEREKIFNMKGNK